MEKYIYDVEVNKWFDNVSDRSRKQLLNIGQRGKSYFCVCVYDMKM